MSRQYNVKVEDEDMADIESAVPGTKGGTAIRVAALMYVRQVKVKGAASPAASAASSGGEGGRSDEA